MNMEIQMARSIQDLVIKEVRKNAPYFTTGVWLQAETVDPNLSQVVVGDNTLRFVPRLSSVTNSPGDIVLMLKAPGIPLTIIGIVIGDITQAEV